MMNLYSLSGIFLLLLPAVKISASTISVNESVATNSLNENSTTNILPTNYQCVNEATWFGTSGFSKQFYDDCQRAWDVMDLADFLRYKKDIWLEFLSTNAKPSLSQLEHLQTPRRYTYGTCTWAIVSLRDVPSGKLPNAPPGFYPTSDVATFDQFFDSALFGVDSRCLKRGTVGYAILGLKHSLVVLVTGTRSVFDRSLPRGVHPPPISNGTPGNITQNALEGQNITIPVLGELNETTSFTTTPQQDVQSS